MPVKTHPCSATNCRQVGDAIHVSDRTHEPIVSSAHFCSYACLERWARLRARVQAAANPKESKNA
jgi:hypothetical protein